MPELDSSVTELTESQWSAPLSVSRNALLIDGSDKACQSLIYNLLTLGLELEACRNVVAEKFDVSGPQYSILMGIARFQGVRGIRASAVADLLNVSAAFITTQTGQLIEKGLLAKERNPADRREVLLKVSASGERLIDQFSTLIRDMNDTLFGELSPEEFRVLIGLIKKMVGAASRTLDVLYAKN